MDGRPAVARRGSDGQSGNRLSIGLKVDVDALPPAMVEKLRADVVDLDDPAVTIALLRLNAVVGVMGKVDDRVG